MSMNWKYRVLSERAERTERMLQTYESLIEYWENSNRVVCASSRLNQSREFIDQRVAECKAKHTASYSFLMAVKAELSSLEG